MILVYAETNIIKEHIATFEDDKLYNDCLPILEQWAKDNGYERITESVQD